MASYSTKIASGTVLTFKEGVVKYAGSEIADTLSGTVVVDRPEPKVIIQFIVIVWLASYLVGSWLFD